MPTNTAERQNAVVPHGLKCSCRNAQQVPYRLVVQPLLLWLGRTFGQEASQVFNEFLPYSLFEHLEIAIGDWPVPLTEGDDCSVGAFRGHSAAFFQV